MSHCFLDIEMIHRYSNGYTYMLYSNDNTVMDFRYNSKSMIHERIGKLTLMKIKNFSAKDKEKENATYRLRENICKKNTVIQKRQKSLKIQQLREQTAQLKTRSEQTPHQKKIHGRQRIT